jgi:hypothetical protein
MNNPHLIDFYHGWLIEVMSEADGFQSVCYSPARGQLHDRTLYATAFEALGIARQRVSRYLACYTLSNQLRELYEVDKLGLEDWQSLSQFLTRLAVTHIEEL